MRVRHLAVCGLLAIGAGAADAQSHPWTPEVLVAGGITAQRNADNDLGSPGWTAAIGVEWTSQRPLGVRVEAQTIRYPGANVASRLDVEGSVEHANVLATMAVWQPTPRVPAYVLLGGAILGARLTTATGARRDQFVSGGTFTGLGVRATDRLGVEAQYLQAARALGRTRSLLAVRVLFRI